MSESAQHRASKHQAAVPVTPLRRIVRLARPYRRLVAVGIVAALCAAALQAASITALLPILKTIIEGEGLHAWLDRKIASDRLLAHLAPYDPGTDAPLPESRLAGMVQPVIVHRMEPHSPLPEAGIRNGDALIGLNGRRLNGRDWLAAVAAAPTTQQSGEEMTIEVARASTSYVETANFNFPVGSDALHWRAIQAAASFIPRPTQGGGAMQTIIGVLMVVGVLSILGSVARFISEYNLSRAILRSVMDLRRQLYGRVLRLPMGFFSRDVSDTVARFVRDSDEVQRGLQTVFSRLVREPAKALFLFAAALIIEWRMTLAVVLAAPWIILIFWLVGRKVRKANRRLLQGWGRMVGALEATLRGIAVVKAYNAEAVERRRLWQIDRRMFKQQLKMAMLDAFVGPAMEVLTLIAGTAGLLWLSAQVLNRSIEPSSFILLGGLLAMLFDPVRKSANVYNRIQRSRAAGERIFSVIDAPIEEETQTSDLSLGPFQRRIEWQEVTFQYDGSDRPALADLSLEIHAGETVAIVGPNGSGKSTLIGTLLRFWEPQQGRILFDGVDIRTVSLKSLRRQFSLVTQDAVIFAMSMTDNIAYGKKRINKDEIADAARHAYADDFIQAMEEGYDSVAGDQGRTLSGGQRQRLAIARAILRDAPIFIFDEATSQVDSESEAKIQRALQELSREKTTLIIAHRLSTIQCADRIVLMDQGRVADSGTHEELYARSTLYRALCQSQFVDVGPARESRRAETAHNT